MNKRLRLVAGPNGSGKTTLTKQLISHYKIPLGNYVNPDEIALELEAEIPDPALRFRQAQQQAKNKREDWLKCGVSHTYESVMSHYSHLEYMREARKLGFRNYLYYVCIGDSDLNQFRVEQRVEEGGHNVPPEKIHQRYLRSLEQLHDMARLCRRAFFFDNTEDLTFIAEISPTGLLYLSEKTFDKLNLDWFVNSLLVKWDREKLRIIE